MTFDDFMKSQIPEDSESRWKYTESQLEKAFYAGRQSAFEESSCAYTNGQKHAAQSCIKIISDAIWSKSGTAATAREAIKAKFGIVE